MVNFFVAVVLNKFNQKIKLEFQIETEKAT